MPKKQSKATIPEKRKVGRPAKYTKAAAMQKKIDKYFATCDKNYEPYTVTGLAIALGMTRKGLIDYENKEDQKLSNTVKKAKLRVEEYAERSLYRSQSVTGIIFNLKNNFGWQDKQEIDQHTTFDFGSATLKESDAS